MSNPKPPEPEPLEFEEFVAAVLKVDPSGLSGKHRKDGREEEGESKPKD